MCLGQSNGNKPTKAGRRGAKVGRYERKGAQPGVIVYNNGTPIYDWGLGLLPMNAINGAGTQKERVNGHVGANQNGRKEEMN